MAIVTMPDSRPYVLPKRICDAVSLRAWLAGRWIILFSHPDDFSQEQFEMDRWVTVLSRSLGERGVAAVALARAGLHPEQGWLGHLAALERRSAAILALEPLMSRTLPDASGRALSTRISRCGPRFAMIMDSELHCRRALSYRLPAELPSPLDLIGWTVALRKRHRDEERAPEPRDPARAPRPGWARAKPLTCIRPERADRMA